MKKSTLLAIACLGMSAMVAQTQRTILYEEFTGENCAPCAATNPGLTTFIHQPGYFPTKVILLRYQCNIPSAPGAGSLYQDNPSEEGVRQTYYSVPFAPYARFDGIVLKEPPSQGTGSDGHAYWIEDATDYPNIVPDSATNNAPFGITVSHMFNATADSVTVTAVITAAQTYTSMSAGSLKLQVAMQEAAIHFAMPTGSNGEKDFYDVMRKMIPNASGTALNNTWASAATQTVTLKAKIPTYIHDKEQIAFVAFVQEDGSKRVHNAAYSQPIPLPLDAATNVINGVTSISCSTTLNPVVVIGNPGATTLTSCNVNYKIDGGTVSTFSWTGSMATGTTSNVTLPTLTTTVGSHTLTVYTSMPNGSTDANPGNDTKANIFMVEPAPGTSTVTEGFVATTFPPANWAINDPDHGTITWARSAAAGNAPTAGNSATFDFYNDATDGDKDELYLPYTDLTGTSGAQLKFDYAYNYFSSVTQGTLYDSLAVMISTNCGTTWSQLFLNGGPGLVTATAAGDSNQYVPATSEWMTKTISLSAYATGPALIKFIAINHYGNDLFLDNINLSFSTGMKSHGAISSVNVFPNPASTQLNLDVNLATSEKVNVAIYNVMGEQVFVQTQEMTSGNNTVVVSTDKLASGIYNVLVTSNSGSYTTKVTVSK